MTKHKQLLIQLLTLLKSSDNDDAKIYMTILGNRICMSLKEFKNMLWNLAEDVELSQFVSKELDSSKDTKI